MENNNKQDNSLFALEQGLLANNTSEQQSHQPSPKKRKRPRQEARAFDFGEAIQLQYNGDAYPTATPAARSFSQSNSFASELEDESLPFEVEAFEVERDVTPVSKPVTPQPETPVKSVEVQPVQATEKVTSKQKVQPVQATKVEQTPPQEGLSDAQEFAADLQAILNGEKTYDAEQKQVVSTSPPAKPEAKVAPTPHPHDIFDKGQAAIPPQKQVESEPVAMSRSHAVFDQMGKNMTHATDFDQGTVDLALEQRFDEFDRILDEEKQKFKTKAIDENMSSDSSDLATSEIHESDILQNDKQLNEKVAQSLSQSEFSQPLAIKPIGYSFVDDLDGDKPLPLDKHLPALTIIQIAQINEAVDRTKQAVELARDCVIEIARLQSLGSDLTQKQTIYINYFGTFDQARAITVKNNFIKLFDALKNPLEVVDHRNTDFGFDCYAATHIQHLPLGKSLRVWIGRDFFNKKPLPQGLQRTNYQAYIADYENTSDATVGTLIHEFSHGVFHAVDAPPLDAIGNWKSVTYTKGNTTILSPNLTPGDNYGASPDNDHQSSTRVLDKRLALHYPEISIRNADNYGQFGCEILLLWERERRSQAEKKAP